MRHAVGATKGRKARSVPIPAFVLDELSVRCQGKQPTDLVFPGRDGGYLPPGEAGDWVVSGGGGARRSDVLKMCSRPESGT